MPEPKATVRNPWAWVTTLYLAEGLPYVVVMTVSVIMYKGLGISNTDIALYTSWLYLPWVIKPLWSPMVDVLQTRRHWIWVMQLIIGGGLAGLALTLPAANFFRYSLAFFWLLAFSSATHDIAVDGFYMLAATEHEQALFSGVRNLFYRIATICGQGLLVMLAGVIQDHTGLPKLELHVVARPGTALIQAVPPIPSSPTISGGKLHVIVNPQTVDISPQPRNLEQVRELIAASRSNNVYYGFSRMEQKAEPSSSSIGSWWTGTVADPLESFLRAHFGQEIRNRSNLAGNIGMAAFQLSQPPGREVVLSLGSRAVGFQTGDDKNFSVAEGARFTFNDQNWNEPALAVIQLDPKMTTAAETYLAVSSGNIPFSWAVSFILLGGMFLFFCVYHKSTLPYPAADHPGTGKAKFSRELFRTFAAFFAKKGIIRLLFFLLFYRFAEAQLVKMATPFLLDRREAGGLGLTTTQVGFVYGTVGVIALMCGGLLGGWVVARRGLKFWLWWMALAIHLPDAVFVYLAHALPASFWTINLCVAVEQFGYGFGFTAYMLYMIYIARGEHQTAHYAICTGFMALGMMIPGMFSGWLQNALGYPHFFVWVLLATIPGFLAVKLIPLDAEFGRRGLIN